jgi:hypothetical protein
VADQLVSQVKRSEIGPGRPPLPRPMRTRAAALLAGGLIGAWGLVATPSVEAPAPVAIEAYSPVSLAATGPMSNLMLSATDADTATVQNSPSLVLVGTVVVRDLPARPSAGHPAQHKPFLSPRLQTPAGSAPARGAVVVDTAGPAAAGGAPPSTRAAALATASATTPTVTTGFPGWSSSQSQTTFNQFWTPPDPQIAAGPAVSGSPTCSSGCLMELVNDVGSLWSKSGSLQSSFDLNAFFKVPSGQTYSDPRVLFDAPSGRWFATGLSFTSSYGSQIYIAVSSTADPSGSWTVYNGDFSSTVLHDQPKIGVSADKLVMSWNDFLGGSSFQGSVIWIIQKSDLLVAGSPAISGVGPDGTRPSIAPAQNLSYDPATANTAYAVYNNSPNVGLLTITGTPRAGTVVMGESDPSMGATGTPPRADQPGYPGSINTNDTRFLTAAWQGGTLWTSTNDACGTVVCARLVAVSTTASPPSVTFSQDLAAAGGGDLYYPAVTIDQSGNIAAVYTVSSMSTYPSVRVVGATLSGSSYTLLSGQTVNSAQSVYSDGSCLASPPCRWGDYSGAAVDPNGKDMWLTGEYAASNAGVNNNWGTYTARLTLSPPTVTGISPSSGAAGTTVTVSGSEFSTVAGATTVSFGTVAATPVSCSSTTTCSAVAPAGSGTVDVRVTVNGQTSATSSSDLFSYGTVANPDFGISASPSSPTVTAGQSTPYTTTVVSSGGFSSAVSLSASPTITGVGFSFTPTSVTPPANGSANSTLTVSTTVAVAPGTYTLTISGTSGSTSHSTTVQLTVQPRPDFAVSASPSSISVGRSQTRSCAVTATSTGGFAGTVTLTVTGGPAGTTFSFSPSQITPAANGSATSTLTISTSRSTPTGTYTLTITGTSGSTSHSTTVTLTITGKH